MARLRCWLIQFKLNSLLPANLRVRWSIRRVWPSPRPSPGWRRIAMRKYLVLSALGACLLAFVSAASAFAGGSTYYAG